MFQTYSVLFINHSPNPGSVCLYQEGPGKAPALVKQAFPHTQVQLDWERSSGFAGPEMSRLWIAFGEFTRDETLDLEKLAQRAEIRFPRDIFSMTATLSSDGRWTLEPTREEDGDAQEGRGQGPGPRRSRFR